MCQVLKVSRSGYYPSGSNIFQLLKDAKVSFADVFFIKVGDKVVKEDYLLTESVEVKLFPIIGGR